MAKNDDDRFDQEHNDPNEKDENVDELMDNDELSPEEEGFMKGYEEDEE